MKQKLLIIDDELGLAKQLEVIEEAKLKWMDQSFNKIEGDETEYILYPTRG